MAFKEKLKRLRLEYRLSQYELGKKIGVHEKHVTKMENSESFPSAETLMKLASIFKISVDHLLFDDIPRNSDIGRLADPELADLIFEADTLSNDDRRIVKEMIKALVTRSKVNELTSPNKRPYSKRS